MRKTAILFFAVLLALQSSAFGQEKTNTTGKLRGGTPLPSTCMPASSGRGADVFVKSGASPGLYLCTATNTWSGPFPTSVSGSGDVVGPGSSTDNTVVRFDLATGKLIQGSLVVIDDSGNVTGLGTLNNKTLPTGTDTLAGLGTAQTFTANQTVNGVVLTSQRNSIGATLVDGTVLQNTTAAAAGAQQWSPCLTLTSQGWKTNSTAASQSTNWCIQNQSVQGAASPTTNLVFSSRVNGGGYTDKMTISSGNVWTGGAGDLTISSGVGGSLNLAITAGSLVTRLGGTGIVLSSGYQLGWSPSGASSAADTIARRIGAANPGFAGNDSATPAAYTLTVGESSRGGTDSNVTGANGILRPGNGTGTGGSGAFKIQVAPVGSTGAVANTYSDALSISNAKVATFSGDIQGVTATFSGAINVASCTGCGGGGTTINASGQGIWIPDVIYDADNFEGVATGNDVKFYRFYNPFAITADRADYKGVVAQASGKFSFSLRSWDCTTTTYFDSGVVDTTSWSNVDVTTTLSSATLPAGGICLMWTHDNTTSKTRVVGPQGNTMAVWNIAPTGAKRAGTCANTSTAGVLPSSCGTQTAGNTQGVFQFTLRKN